MMGGMAQNGVSSNFLVRLNKTHIFRLWFYDDVAHPCNNEVHV